MIENQEEISKIINDELGVEYFVFKQHNPSYTTVEINEMSILCKNDISPKEFRSKVAEHFLDNIQDLLKRSQARLDRAEKMVKVYNEMYEEYHKIVEGISNEQIDSLKPLSWDKFSKYLK